ncbi:MAG: hypothetical protein CTY16_05925 [Methylobacter sp.]|nr:MAG: hypothetical protein CTY16_05925 [Methylobacter sp.]
MGCGFGTWDAPKFADVPDGDINRFIRFRRRDLGGVDTLLGRGEAGSNFRGACPWRITGMLVFVGRYDDGQ